jgi:hypothetical protein
LIPTIVFAVTAAAALPPFEQEMAKQPKLEWFEFYKLAAELQKKGAREDAGVAFYVGQLRGRAHAMCEPGDLTGTPALLGSLNEVVGRAINEDLGVSNKRWQAAIKRALAWDEAHPEAALIGPKCLKSFTEVRTGLRKLLAQIGARREEIRRTRTENGLPNEAE